MAIIFGGLVFHAAEAQDLSGKHVAVIIADGFHDAETLSPVFHLRNHNVDTTFIGFEKGFISAYNSDVSVEIQKTLAEVDVDEFDAVILPGGGSPAVLRENRDVLRFLRAFAETGRPIAGICHGPQVMASAGIVDGVELTGFSAIRNEMTEAGGIFVDREVVVDGPFITSRIPEDLPAFNDAIVEALLN